uniref:Uncharacterized protein n=1 Tax=Meleagris gallopavo TaxID=9103 RepID=A0A803Y107_MELGA
GYAVSPHPISNLQKGSSEVFSHSLQERDLEMRSLRRESEKLKRDHALTTGLVTSLQREIAVKEQKIQQLKQEVEKTKKANREKDNQLAVVSAKVSVPSAGLIGALAWKRKIRRVVFLSVKDSLDIRKNFFTERENQQSQAREKCLQEEISSKLSKEKEMTENVEVFKKSLREASFCSSSLRSELTKLEAMLVDPLVLDIHAAVVEITHVVLSWLEEAEQLLTNTGLELPTSKKGALRIWAFFNLPEMSGGWQQFNQC